MKRIIKSIIVVFVTSTLIISICFVLSPDSSKEFYRKTVFTTKKAVLHVRSKIQKERYHSPKELENKIWGIDISHHQREINWHEINKTKPYFVFLKATEGSSHIDSKYPIYYKNFKKYEIPVGAYHFFSYETKGENQAKNYIRASTLKKGDFYPVLDVEFTNKMKDKDWIVKEIKAYCSTIKKEFGVNPIIYCEYDYFNKFLKQDFAEFNYWISDFWREPRIKYIFWQKTDKFSHSAFQGTIDFNIFSGTKEELNNFKL